MSDERELQEILSTQGQCSSKPEFASEGNYNSCEKEEMCISAETKETPKAYNQFMQTGSGYLAASPTVKTIPPGSYTLGLSRGTAYFEPQKILTDTLLRLPDSKSEEIIKEVENFWTLEPKFKKYGYIFKRGFLLWGGAGSGKTSAIAVISEEMIKRGGVVFIAGDPGILGECLKQFRMIETQRPIMVIWEDFEQVVNSRNEADVLAILDGEAQVNNIVFMATTNYPEQLGPRIINRPSRFDRRVKIGMPNAESRKMYLMVKLGKTVEDGVDLVKETEGLSIAHLRELIVGVYCQENPVREVLDRLKSMGKPIVNDHEDITSNKLGIGMGSRR